MLVIKSTIKTILLLIFVLVIYQISQTSQDNYIAYALVAIGFFLVYTEMNVEGMDNVISPELEQKFNSQSSPSTTELIAKAELLEKERTDELNKLKQQEEKKQVEDTDVSLQVPCEKSIAEAIAPLQAEISKLRAATKIELEPDEAKLKTFNLLIEYLSERNAVSNEDIDSLKAKMEAGLVTMDEAIGRLEKMKFVAKTKNMQPIVESNKNWWSEMQKSELPLDMYVPKGSQISAEFSNEYAILNTDKWTVPMPRPPVCIDSKPKEIMPIGTTGYPLNLKYFDEARYVSTSAATEMEKKQ